ncbi:MAG: class I SAM-dependent methyltransferase [Candidatus Omnitrophota bacterium]
MSYKVYIEKQEDRPWQGDAWRDESLEENLSLCAVQTLHDLLLSTLPKKGKILEAGCGLGRWVIYLNERGYQTVGLEIYEDALKPARRQYPHCPFVVGNVLKLPYLKNSFDAVISLGVLEHFEEGPREALQEIYRILKPGGILFLTVPFESFLRRWIHRPYHHTTIFVKKSLGKDFHFGEYRYHQREMEQFLLESGFQIREVHPDDFRPPKCLGFYTDWMRYVAKEGEKWELNRFGRILVRLLDTLSPWAYPSGILFIADKKF